MLSMHLSSAPRCQSDTGHACSQEAAPAAATGAPRAEGFDLDLAGAACVWLSTSVLLISLSSGQLILLMLHFEGALVRRLKVLFLCVRSFNVAQYVLIRMCIRVRIYLRVLVHTHVHVYLCQCVCTRANVACAYVCAKACICMNEGTSAGYPNALCAGRWKLPSKSFQLTGCLSWVLH